MMKWALLFSLSPMTSPKRWLSATASAVLHKGHLAQIGTPMEIYEAPNSSFVADFIGDTNFLDGTS